MAYTRIDLPKAPTLSKLDKILLSMTFVIITCILIIFVFSRASRWYASPQSWFALIIIAGGLTVYTSFLFPISFKQRSWRKTCKQIQQEAERYLTGKTFSVSQIWLDNPWKWDDAIAFDGQPIKPELKGPWLVMNVITKGVNDFENIGVLVKNVKKGQQAADWKVTIEKAPFMDGRLNEHKAVVVLSGPWQF